MFHATKNKFDTKDIRASKDGTLSTGIYVYDTPKNISKIHPDAVDIHEVLVRSKIKEYKHQRDFTLEAKKLFPNSSVSEAKRKLAEKLVKDGYGVVKAWSEGHGSYYNILTPDVMIKQGGN